LIYPNTTEPTDLAAYLSRCTLIAQDAAHWGSGRIHLELAYYLTTEEPPIEYVTSVRGLLFRSKAVLVQSDLDGVHILPGGRCEPGETLEQTLRREVLEETGWTIDRPQLLGCLHFHHLSPKPPAYAYVYPDFLQPVFTANAMKHAPDHQVQDAYVVESRFRTLAEIAELHVPVGQRMLLAAALRAITPPDVDVTVPPAEPQQPSALPSEERSS
jgi:ADP-ribose pyrophosphatase YjhB (NUDIX family)